MPTPTGLPAKGDVVRHKVSGQMFEVMERAGQGKDYSLVIHPLGGHVLPKHLQRGGRNEMLLTEAHYWLRMSGQWELLDPRDVKFDQLVDKVHAANPDIDRKRLERIVTLVRILSGIR